MIKSLISDSINLCIIEFKKDKNRKKIEDEILSPVIEFILEKIKPYILGMSIFLVTIILLIICILCLSIMK